jgi:hypothetical protein
MFLGTALSTGPSGPDSDAGTVDGIKLRQSPSTGGVIDAGTPASVDQVAGVGRTTTVVRAVSRPVDHRRIGVARARPAPAADTGPATAAGDSQPTADARALGRWDWPRGTAADRGRKSDDSGGGDRGDRGAGRDHGRHGRR